MKAIILAAGSGRRMRPLTDTTHKTMLVVGGKTVIQWIVDALLANGITDIVIATGHLAGALRAYLEEAYPSLSFTYVHNERFAQTNNIYTLSLVLEQVPLDSDVVLIECDLIFEPTVIRRLIDSPHPNVALLDRYRIGMDGTVVEVSEGIVTEVITPDRQGAAFSFADKYKTLNIYRFSRDFCGGTFRKLLTHYARAISDNAYYEVVLGIIIYLQHEVVHAEILDGEEWAELDDPTDIGAATFRFDPSTRRQTMAESHGGYWSYDVLDFAFLRNMYFPTGAVLSELRNNLPTLVQNYGSSGAILSRKLANYLLCRPELLTVLSGASQVFPWWRDYFTNARALIPSPTFGEYERSFPQADSYHDEVGLDPEQIASRAKGHDVVVVVNPNNPTGSLLPTRRIHQLAAGLPETTLIVDESFIEFSAQPSLLSLLEAEPLPNVLVLKSLGKVLGVPGLRLGCVYTANPGFRAFLRSVLPVWSLGSMAEFFLEVVLKHRGAIEASFERTAADRERLGEQLGALSLIEKVYPSGGNFLLVSLHSPREASADLVEALLLRHGIYVKDVSSRFADGRAYWRLAVRRPDENARLLAALAQIPASSAVHAPLQPNGRPRAGGQ